MKVSVIVPTYKCPNGLPACLEGLASQDYPGDRYEVIVVDDGGRDVPESLVAAFRTRMQVRLLHACHGGPAAARNAGAAVAAGDILAFTDDDCVPAPGWLQALARAHQASPGRLFGGRIVNALARNPYSTASQLLIDYLYDYFGEMSRPGGFFTSNNIAVSTEGFRCLGGFDTTFVGPAGEDRDLCDRWVRDGGALCYVPEAIVYHAHPLTFTSFWRLHGRYGRAAYQVRLLRARRSRQRVRLEPPSFYVGLVGYPLRLGGVRRRILLAGLLLLSQVANALGYCREGLSRRPSIRAFRR